jgi:EpsI family protein
MVLCAGGWRMGRAYFAPIVLLLFMVPLPLISIAHLNYELKHLAASGAVALVNVLPGPAVRLDGSMANWAGPQPGRMLIGDACSGLRGIVAMTWIAAVLAARRGLTPLARGSLLAAAIPTALAINLVRVAMLLGIGRAVGVDAVAPDTTAHDLVGIACFAVGIAALCGMDTLLRNLTLPFDHQSTRSERGRTSRADHLASPRPMPAWSLVSLLGAGLVIAVIQHPQHAAEAPDFDRIPSAVALAGETFHGTDMAIPEHLVDYLGNPAMLHRRYLTPEGTWAFDLQIVQHTHDRRALHPPEVCLRGSGMELTDRRVITLPRDAPAADDPIRVVAFTAKRDQQTYPVRFVYRSGDVFTSSLLRVQAGMLATRLVGRNASGAVIRIDAASERLADRAAATLLPHFP